MGRHSAASSTTHAVAGTTRRLPVRWIAVGLAIAVVTFVVIKIFTADETAGVSAQTPTTEACDGSAAPVQIVVAAPAAAAPAIKTITSRLVADHVGVGDRCIIPTVLVQPSDQTAAVIANEASVDLPDVWISDSRVWVQRAQTSPIGSARTGGAATIARTPLVLAMSRTAAERTGWPDTSSSWADVAVGMIERQATVLPDPTVASAGLGLVMTVATVLGDDEDSGRTLVSFVRAAAATAVDDVSAALDSAATSDEAPAVATTEQAVVAYNASGPAQPLVAVYPGDSQLPLELTLGLVHADPVSESADAEAETRLRAALRLREAVQSDAGRQTLAEAGFRGADGSATGAVTTSAGVLPDHTTELVVDAGTTAARALGAWEAATLDAQILAVLDVSGSMDEPVADGRTRLQVATSAAAFALSLFPSTSEFGLWSFSTGLEGGADHVELVPIGSLGDPIDGVPRSQALADALGALEPTGDTSLYDTTLAAYQTAQIAYDPGKVNSVVILTDGVNDDDVTISLDQLVAALTDAADPARPVQIVYVAIGQAVDVPTLEQIVATVNGAVYQADAPEDIQQIYLDALVRRVG